MTRSVRSIAPPGTWTAPAARGFERLAADNARAWARRWETDIEVEGNPELQRVVRSMLFYLLCSADSGTKLGIPPMGLSSARLLRAHLLGLRYLDVPARCC